MRSIIEEIMMDVMFDIPSNEAIEKVIITKEAAELAGEPTIVYKDSEKKLAKTLGCCEVVYRFAAALSLVSKEQMEKAKGSLKSC